MTSTWPLFDLRVRTPRLTLRPIDDELAVALCHLADLGIHPPDTMPFQVPWTLTELPRRHWETRQYYWSCWAGFGPEQWKLPLAAEVDGVLVGMQELSATNFAVERTVGSGSWIAMAHQGQGLGTEMRQAMLHLAFVGLGAAVAESGAWLDNLASQRVSERCGYERDGRQPCASDTGRPSVGYRLERARWETVQRTDIQIEALTPALGLFGL